MPGMAHSNLQITLIYYLTIICNSQAFLLHSRTFLHQITPTLQLGKNLLQQVAKI